MAGILVVSGIGIGAFLSTMFPSGFGTGQGINGIGNPVATAPVVEGGPSAEEQPEETNSVAPVLTSETSEKEVPEEVEPIVAPALVYVLIDGYDYLLRRGPEGKAPYKAASIDEVVEAAANATGDENGIRIRIARRNSARESAERALQSKLEAGGVTSEAVRWKDEPVSDDSSE